MKALSVRGCGLLLALGLAGKTHSPACAQHPLLASDSAHAPVNHRLRWLVIGEAATYGVTLLALNQLWYANNPRTRFHFFNDNAQWLQVDKVGHGYTAFHLSRLGMEAYQWAGLPSRKAALWSGLTSTLVMTPIEILDGFSAGYGASWGDAVANLTGPALFIGQFLAWNEVRMHPKFSFHQTSLAAQRPNTLGSGLAEEFLKDYNGQTYWLSINVRSFLRNRGHFPRWLNVALGYGGQQMVYAVPAENLAQGYQAYRQYYLALDLDLSHVRSKHKFLQALLFALDAVKIPAPTLEWNPRQGWRLHPLYF